jgi:hypothetical protein
MKKHMVTGFHKVHKEDSYKTYTRCGFGQEIIDCDVCLAGLEMDRSLHSGTSEYAPERIAEKLRLYTGRNTEKDMFGQLYDWKMQASRKLEKKRKETKELRREVKRLQQELDEEKAKGVFAKLIDKINEIKA